MMITVTVERDAAGRVVRFAVSGHAGYDEHGKDIVCAAVSALVLTTVHGLREIAVLPVDYQITSGKIACNLVGLDETQHLKAQLLCETMLLGLKSTAREYPEYLQIVDQGGERDV